MNIEYGLLANYYDVFYNNKNYEKEVNFLIELIKQRKFVLDAGCGTGKHGQLLSNKGYIVDAFDLSEEMINIAKERINGTAYVGNILDFNNEKKYDAIISMFAVFNHLNTIKELSNSIDNLYRLLNNKGVLIIDLHNGRTDGNKTDELNGIQRFMSWNYSESDNKEYTTIKYLINDKIYETSHVFNIYTIEQLNKVLKKYNYKLFENYSTKEANNNSKNVQVVIIKEEN